MTTGRKRRLGCIFATIASFLSQVVLSQTQPPIRINAGGKNYTDSKGNLWVSDSINKYYNDGTRTFSTSRAISQTTEDAIYQTERWSPRLKYNIPIQNGLYLVKLHFVELYSKALGSGKRVFDVVLEDTVRLETIDIYDETGAGFVALIKTATLKVSDGDLTIDFQSRIQSSKIAAIEIHPAAEPPLYINAGGPTVQDTKGNTWVSDKGFYNVGRRGVSFQPIKGTDNGVIYQTGRWHPSSRTRMKYEVPVEPGDYAVYLHFSETYSKAQVKGKRRFDIWIEDELVFENFDIFEKGGGFRAVIMNALTFVSDGLLTIEFAKIVQHPAISGIEVHATVPPIYINAGSRTNYTDSQGRVWVADSILDYHNAGNTYVSTATIAGTEDQSLFQSERWQSNKEEEELQYSIPVANGDYLVRLYFAEVYKWTKRVGKRVFSVAMQGNLVFGSIDIYKDAGNAADTALVKSAFVSVANGSLTIRFLPLAQNAKVCAISVEPLRSSVLAGPTSIMPSAALPSPSPSLAPSPIPSEAPTLSSIPSFYPTVSPAPSISAAPTSNRMIVVDPTISPRPSPAPTTSASPSLSAVPSSSPTSTLRPTLSQSPSAEPSVSFAPSISALPSISPMPSPAPSEAPTFDFEPIRINCGERESYTDSSGLRWEADKYFVTGIRNIKTDVLAIANTDDPIIYRSERWSDFKYEIPVPAGGTFIVTLHFAETFSRIDKPGQRVFDVLVENETAIKRLDIFEEVGTFAALQKRLIVPVSDGKLTISFLFRKQNPTISGIEVELAPPTAAPSAAPSVSAEPSIPTFSPAPSDTPSISPSMFPTETLLPWTDLVESENYIARHECSFVQAGNKFYSFGGRESAKQLDIYDYATNTWSQGASLPEELNHAQAVVYENLIWVIGAFKTNRFPDEEAAQFVYVFDPANDVWMQGPSLPWPRGGAGVVVYRDKIYIIGGNTSGHAGGFCEWMDELDPRTGQWRPYPDAPHARDHFHAVVAGDRLYTIGGRRSSRGNMFGDTVKEVDVFDFPTKKWLVEDLPPDLPSPRAASAAALFDGKIMIMGGEAAQQQEAFSRVDALDLETNRWSSLTPMNHGRHGTQAIVSGKGVYIAGGSPNRGGGNQHNMEVYNVNAPEGEELVAGVLRVFREGATAVTLRHVDGNQGVFINSVVVRGAAASKFVIKNRATSGVLIRRNGVLTIDYEYTGNQNEETATLKVTHSGDQVINIPLLGMK